MIRFVVSFSALGAVQTEAKHVPSVLGLQEELCFGVGFPCVVFHESVLRDFRIVCPSQFRRKSIDRQQQEKGQGNTIHTLTSSFLWPYPVPYVREMSSVTE